MTRREYPIPAHLSGSQLASELTAAGVTTSVLAVSVVGDLLVILWRRNLSAEEIATVDQVVAAHDWTPAKETARRRAVVQARAQALSLSLDDAQAVIARAGLRVAYGAIVEMRQTLQALVTWANGQGAGVPPLGPARTWKQVLAAGRQIAAGETDPEA